MASLNKAQLIGNVGQAPDVRSTQNGQQVASFSIATSERWKDKSGTLQEKTEWHRIVVWGKLSDIVARYVTKGAKIYVEGQIVSRKYEDKQGNERLMFEIKARDIVLLGDKRQTVEDDGPDPSEPQGHEFEDEIPF